MQKWIFMVSEADEVAVKILSHSHCFEWTELYAQVVEHFRSGLSAKATAKENTDFHFSYCLPGAHLEGRQAWMFSGQMAMSPGDWPKEMI